MMNAHLRRKSNRRGYQRLSFESLEDRRVMAAAVIAEVEPNDTLSAAQDLQQIGEFIVQGDTGVEVDRGSVPTRRTPDLDAYRFRLDRPQEAELRLTKTASSGVYGIDAELFNASGQLLSQFRIDDSETQLTASLGQLATGTYSVRLTPVNTTTLTTNTSLSFAYSLAVAGRGGPLTSGQELAASIPQGSFNVHQFTASVGDEIRLSIGQPTGSTGGQPLLELFGPDGSQITAGVFNSTSNSNDDASAAITASAGGVYTARIADAFLNDSLDYNIRLLTLPDTNPVQLAGRDINLTSGQEVTASIPQGSFNVHQFTASVGDEIRLSIGQPAGSTGGQPFLEVFGPDGSEITAGVFNSSSTNSNDSSAAITASAGGVYTARIADNGLNEFLDYNIVASGITAPANQPPTLTGLSDVTTPFETAITIAFVIGDDQTATGNLSVTASASSTFFDLPASRLSGSGSNRSLTLVPQLGAVGTSNYTVGVTDEQGSINSQTFQITILPDNVLTNGEEVQISLAAGGEKTHRFTAAAGARVRVDVGEVGDAEPVLDILDPNGNLVTGVVADDAAFVNASVSFSAAVSGIYTARIRESGNDDALDYRLRVLAVPGNFDIIAGRDAVLNLNQPFSSSAPAGSFNVHRFNVAVGEQIRVGVNESGIAEPRVQIVDPAGNLLGSDFGSIDAEVQFTATTAGVYTALVSDSGGNDSITYSIIAESTSPGGTLASGGLLLPGATLSSPSGRYQFTLQNDGNVVLLDRGLLLFHTRTFGQSINRLEMQTDGNLVLYNTGGAAVFNTGTQGNAGATLTLTDDGLLRVVSADGAQVLWAPPTVLGPGRLIRPGQSLESPSGRYRLVLQTDGNLVLYDGPSPQFRTDTFGRTIDRLEMQSDGNLVMYDTGGRPVFFTSTQGNPGARLRVGDDGVLRILAADDTSVLWVPSVTLAPSEQLRPGQSLFSPSGRYQLAMQNDGNLVLYDGSRPLFSSNTFGRSVNRLEMQTDGNLVIYDTAGRAIFSTNTQGNPGARLRLGDDGLLRVLAADDVQVLWSRP